MRKLRMGELGRKTAAEVKGASKIPVIVVLENIRSAYNVGSVFRTADAFLLEGVYLVGYTALPPHKEIHKTALGAEESVSWKHFKTMAEAIEAIHQLGYTLMAAEQTDRSVALHQWEEPVGPGLALVLGNEVTGVELETLKACEQVLEIPQLGMKHSLNIATAAGVMLWEIVRRKIINNG